MPADLTGSNVDPRHVLWQDYYSPGVGQDYTSSAGALINDLTSKRVKDLLSGYATSGLSRSGIQGAAVNNAYSQAGQQLSSVAAQGSQMDSNKRLQILRLLFGEQAQEANQPSAWGQIAGSLLSGGAQVGSAALLASDKRLKENIKKTGEKTKDGIPIVEFNFKGESQRLRGVLAQDVEKVKPRAIYKAVDTNKIPEAKYITVED